jgi:uncharacterized membrane protein YagU involved in acid resistance
VDSLPYWAGTAVAHVAYGAAAAMPLPFVMRRSSAGLAAVYGLAVWAASYLGWLPLLGIQTFPTRHPLRRTAAMIAAHVVWAVTTTGLLGAPRRQPAVWLEGPVRP